MQQCHNLKWTFETFPGKRCESWKKFWKPQLGTLSMANLVFARWLRSTLLQLEKVKVLL